MNEPIDSLENKFVKFKRHLMTLEPKSRNEYKDFEYRCDRL